MNILTPTSRVVGAARRYRFTERWATTDVAIRIGAGREATDFTEESLGRALDKLARAHPARVLSAIAAQAYLVTDKVKCP